MKLMKLLNSVQDIH